MKCLGDVIVLLTWLRDNHGLRGFETVGPETRDEACVNDPDEKFQDVVIDAKAFNVCPCNVICAWRRPA